jgi:hypothetical protein
MSGEVEEGAAPTKPDHLLPLSVRYQQAWSELIQRLDARQISYLGHAVACGTLATLFSGLFINLSPSTPDAFLWGVSPALVGLAFACWIRSHDLSIGLLSRFCGACETIADGADNPSTRFPQWHALGSDLHESSKRQREWLEIAFVILSFLTTEVATYYYVLNLKEHPREVLQTVVMPILAFNHFVLGISSWCVLSICQFRYRLSRVDYKYDEKDRNWKFSPGFCDVHPFDLMSWCFVVVVAGCLAWRYLSRWGYELGWQLPCLVLILAGGLRYFAALLDCDLRIQEIGSSQAGKFPRPPLSSSFWIWSILLTVFGFVFLGWQPSWISALPQHAAALLTAMFLAGFAVPDQIDTWRRFTKCSKKKSIRKAQNILAEGVSRDLKGIWCFVKGIPKRVGHWFGSGPHHVDQT